MNKKEKNKFDLDLLVELVSTQSSFSEDTEINNLIEKKISNISGVSISKDAFGNIYAVKGAGGSGYKCIVAHTDTVHAITQNRKVYLHGSTLFAMADSQLQSGPRSAQVGIGGDDRSGVYAAIKALMDFDNIKAVFFRFEETGCRGSRASNMNFFDDCNFVVQLDRKGNSDFITHTNGIKVASKEFEDQMSEVYKKFGFNSAIGSSTDVGALKSRGLKVSACNISSGYFDPHSRFETIDIDGLHNAYLMVCSMFDVHGNTKFKHEHVPISTIHRSNKHSRLVQRPRDLFSDSYFANALADANKKYYDIIGPKQPKRMKLLPIIQGWPLTYRFIDNDVIDMAGLCPKCGSKDSIMYLTEDRAFMCSDSQHSDWVASPSLFRDLLIEEDDTQYVYNRVYNIWMHIEDALWDSDLQTYVPVITE